MNIQSTRPRLAKPASKIAEDYQKTKAEFLSSAEQQQDRFEHFEKWSTRATFGSGIAAGAGALYLAMNYAPTLEGYGAGFAVVGPAFAVGAAVHYAANKLMEKSLAKTDFLETRSKFVETRDQYRQALLGEVDDKGVADATEPRWTRLKSYENLERPVPSSADFKLTQEVNNLQLLANARTGEGWQKAIAVNQDDPNKFFEELELVSSHDGIRQALISGHGG